MARFTARFTKALLCSAVAISALPAIASADDRWDSDRGRRGNVRVDVNHSRDRFPRGDRNDASCVPEQRVWVEPVYRTVCDRLWIEPVYRDVCERVWHDPIYEDRCERVWVPERFEYRDVVRLDWRGGRIVCREKVCVEPGHYEEQRIRVCVSEGFWEDIRRREVVCEGHWKTIERRVCVSEGYWTTRPGRGGDSHRGDRYARVDRGGRYDD